MKQRATQRGLWIAALALVAGAWFAGEEIMGDSGRKDEARQAVSSAPAEADSSLYSFQVRTLEGQPSDLSTFRGKVALVVNVASRCGLTPQYEGLEALHKEFQGRGFTVLGFPSNDFLGQEPGTPEEIREFCSANYGVTFPLFEKMHVKGKKKSPVYQFLTRDHDEPSWNFTKYLIGADGRVIARFDPRTKPDDAELRRQIEAALGGAR